MSASRSPPPGLRPSRPQRPFVTLSTHSEPIPVDSYPATGRDAAAPSSRWRSDNAIPGTRERPGRLHPAPFYGSTLADKSCSCTRPGSPVLVSTGDARQSPIRGREKTHLCGYPVQPAVRCTVPTDSLFRVICFRMFKPTIRSEMCAIVKLTQEGTDHERQ